MKTQATEPNQQKSLFIHLNFTLPWICTFYLFLVLNVHVRENYAHYSGPSHHPNAVLEFMN